jgi:thioredoxin reductase (NADPH)
MEKVVIIGSGPAGQTAAIYCARANLNPVVFEGMVCGGAPGGQLMTTTDIENFPGFPDAVPGPQLMERMRAQALKCGARLFAEDVASVDLSVSPIKIKGASTTVECRTLIIATGATARRMGVPSEPKLWGRGISACATCDGALPIFRNKELLVVGGGDTAIEEALHLTHFASRVYIAHRRDQFRACPLMQKRALEHPKVTVLWNTVLLDAKGATRVEAALLQDVKTNAVRELPVAGIFYAVGHVPNTAFLAGQVSLDAAGYVVTNPKSTQTSAPGVFACGDVQDTRYRQAVSAAGTGCMAALDAQRYLESLGE